MINDCMTVFWRISGMLNDCMRVFWTPGPCVRFVKSASDVEGCLITECGSLPEVDILKQFLHDHAEDRANCFVWFSEWLHKLHLALIKIQVLMKHIPHRRAGQFQVTACPSNRLHGGCTGRQATGAFALAWATCLLELHIPTLNRVLIRWTNPKMSTKIALNSDNTFFFSLFYNIKCLLLFARHHLGDKNRCTCICCVKKSF